MMAADAAETQPSETKSWSFRFGLADGFRRTSAARVRRFLERWALPEGTDARGFAQALFEGGRIASLLSSNRTLRLVVGEFLWSYEHVKLARGTQAARDRVPDAKNNAFQGRPGDTHHRIRDLGLELQLALKARSELVDLVEITAALSDAIELGLLFELNAGTEPESHSSRIIGKPGVPFEASLNDALQPPHELWGLGMPWELAVKATSFVDEIPPTLATHLAGYSLRELQQLRGTVGSETRDGGRLTHLRSILETLYNGSKLAEVVYRLSSAALTELFASVDLWGQPIDRAVIAGLEAEGAFQELVHFGLAIVHKEPQRPLHPKAQETHGESSARDDEVLAYSLPADLLPIIARVRRRRLRSEINGLLTHIGASQHERKGPASKTLRVSSPVNRLRMTIEMVDAISQGRVIGSSPDALARYWGQVTPEIPFRHFQHLRHLVTKLTELELIETGAPLLSLLQAPSLIRRGEPCATLMTRASDDVASLSAADITIVRECFRQFLTGLPGFHEVMADLFNLNTEADLVLKLVLVEQNWERLTLPARGLATDKVPSNSDSESFWALLFGEDPRAAWSAHAIDGESTFGAKEPLVDSHGGEPHSPTPDQGDFQTYNPHAYHSSVALPPGAPVRPKRRSPRKPCFTEELQLSSPHMTELTQAVARLVGQVFSGLLQTSMDAVLALLAANNRVSLAELRLLVHLCAQEVIAGRARELQHFTDHFKAPAPLAPWALVCGERARVASARFADLMLFEFLEPLGLVSLAHDSFAPTDWARSWLSSTEAGINELPPLSGNQ